MNYTTLEQSKKLVELGLNPDTADMFYSRRPTGKSEYNVFPDFKPEGRLEVFTKVDLPCWSLGALLEVMPISIEEAKEHKLELLFGKLHKEKWGCSYFDWTEMRHGPFTVNDTPLEAAYTMVCWLLKNNYIKKGE